MLTHTCPTKNTSFRAVSVRYADLDAFVADLDRTGESEPTLPGAAFGIGFRGEPVYRSAFGFARLDDRVRLTPATPMAIGSITKHLVSMAFLGLRARSRVDLDARVRSVLPELHSSFDAVTIRHLMTHVSGLRDAYDLAANFGAGSGPIDADMVLAHYAAPIGFNASPDTCYCYNNGAYMLLARAAERISGHRLETLLAQNLFGPARMASSALHRFDPVEGAAAAGCYVRDAGEGWRAAPRVIEGLGMGGVYASVDDMLRWLAALDAPASGFADFWQEMMRPHRLADGASTGYGLGVGWARYHGLDTIGHAGGVAGASAQMLKVPALDLDIVTISNRSDLSATVLALQLLDRCVSGLGDPPATTRPIQGLYRSDETGSVALLSESEEGQRLIFDGVESPLAFAGTNVLAQLPWADPARFSLYCADDSAASDAVILHAHGSSDRLRRMNADAAPRSVAPGDYASAAVGLDASVSGDGRSLETRGRLGRRCFALDPIAGALWHVRPEGQQGVSGVITVESDQQFSFSNIRNRRLVFDRAAAAHNKAPKSAGKCAQ